MNNAQPINIFMAFNDAYAQHASVTIASILCNTRATVHFYILNADIAVQTREKINALRNLGNLEIFYVTTDKRLFSDLPTYRWPEEIWFRLRIPWIKINLDKALYLDSDIVVRNDISELWDVDVSNVFAAAVEDIASGIMETKKFLSKFLPDGMPYFNSGVLAMNLKKIRETYGWESLAAIAYKYRDVIKYPDQDILNMAFGGNVRWLPLKWNVNGGDFFRDKSPFSKKYAREIASAREDPAIAHFTGEGKPWIIPSGLSANPYASEYFKYLRHTPFAENEAKIFSATPPWKNNLRYWWRHPLFFLRRKTWNIRHAQRVLKEKFEQ
ncbi:glycosyltransferase family 8 protein [Termitidicoccus mucosus]|uniref:Glycosyl transferase n=1 Tax=Termitidicoccus mucosus TaxID=1184151 RepID=A0A178IJM5_9BACT|nr:hypothetical protein AW736_11675 [Opitutaceae bacterium TSB47]